MPAAPAPDAARRSWWQPLPPETAPAAGAPPSLDAPPALPLAEERRRMRRLSAGQPPVFFLQPRSRSSPRPQQPHTWEKALVIRGFQIELADVLRDEGCPRLASNVLRYVPPRLRAFGTSDGGEGGADSRRDGRSILDDEGDEIDAHADFSDEAMDVEHSLSVLLEFLVGILARSNFALSQALAQWKGTLAQEQTRRKKAEASRDEAWAQLAAEQKLREADTAALAALRESLKKQAASSLYAWPVSEAHTARSAHAKLSKLAQAHEELREIHHATLQQLVNTRAGLDRAEQDCAALQQFILDNIAPADFEASGAHLRPAGGPLAADQTPPAHQPPQPQREADELEERESSRDQDVPSPSPDSEWLVRTTALSPTRDAAPRQPPSPRTRPASQHPHRSRQRPSLAQRPHTSRPRATRAPDKGAPQVSGRRVSDATFERLTQEAEQRLAEIPDLRLAVLFTRWIKKRRFAALAEAIADEWRGEPRRRAGYEQRFAEWQAKITQRWKQHQQQLDVVREQLEMYCENREGRRRSVLNQNRMWAMPPTLTSARGLDVSVTTPFILGLDVQRQTPLPASGRRLPATAESGPPRPPRKRVSSAALSPTRPASRH